MNMLRQTSAVAAAAAVIGLCALPASAATTQAAPPSRGDFTVPSAGSSIKAWGSYSFTTRNGEHVVQVTLCAERSAASSSFVVAEAEAYNSSGKQDGTIAAVVGPQTPGQKTCGTAFLGGTAHLKVFSEIESGSKIVATKLKSIY
jgi:hypothetical protein